MKAFIERVKLRKRRIDSTFIGDLIQLGDRWYEIETEIVLDMLGNKAIRARVFMAAEKETILKENVTVTIPIQTKVIVLKNRHPLWLRMLKRIVR